MSVMTPLILAILSSISTAYSAGEVAYKSCDDPIAIYNNMLPAVVKVVWETPTAVVHGSGLVVDSEGKVVTSTHVIKAAKGFIEITDSSGHSFKYVKDKVGDSMSVSSLRPVSNHPKSFIELKNIDTVPGEQLVTAGYPFDYEESFNTGFVMSMFNYHNRDFIISSMSVSPGMSGSAVVNCMGQPVGFAYAFDTRGGVISIMNHVKDALDL